MSRRRGNMMAGRWRWSSAGETYRRRWAVRWLASGSAALLLCAASALGASYHFRAGWDGSKLWKDACVTVEAERIQSVGPCGGPSADLTRYTAIPGVTDVHTDMT